MHEVNLPLDLGALRRNVLALHELMVNMQCQLVLRKPQPVCIAQLGACVRDLETVLPALTHGDPWLVVGRLRDIRVGLSNVPDTPDRQIAALRARVAAILLQAPHDPLFEADLLDPPAAPVDPAREHHDCGEQCEDEQGTHQQCVIL